MQDEQIEKIVNYWDGRASKHGVSGLSTLLDHNMRTLETETATSWLRSADRVLDIFCGNGASTVQLARKVQRITGVDLSTRMLEAAAQQLRQPQAPPTNVSFEKCNVLEVASRFPPGAFDAVTSIRGLINLPTWELQKQAIASIHQILPKGGRLVMIEGSRVGLDAINELRAARNLAPINEPWFDRYFDDSELDRFLEPLFAEESTRDLSAYFLVSRVLYPEAALPAEPSFDHVCNVAARLLVPFVDTKKFASLVFCKHLVKR